MKEMKETSNLSEGESHGPRGPVSDTCHGDGHADYDDDGTVKCQMNNQGISTELYNT